MEKIREPVEKWTLAGSEVLRKAGNYVCAIYMKGGMGGKKTNA